MKNKIAIIGGGVAGLTAGHLLHDRHHITVFEKQQRLGGNAYTYATSDGEDVDIAVAAFGVAGYANFYKLLARLGIKTSWSPDAYMSMHDLDTQKGCYITPLSLRSLVAQRFGLFHPSHAVSAAKLFLGLRRGNSMLRAGRLRGLTLEQALDYIPSLRGEAKRFLLCALCLMSSMSSEEVLRSPAEFFFQKLAVHNDVISPKAVYSVRCVKTKTQSYVDALARDYQDRIELGADIQTVERKDDCVELVMKGGDRATFDKVIFACHADQALGLLAKPTDNESNLLGKWKYKDGRVVLHKDHSSFPRRELMQAYTFLYTERDGTFDTSVNGALWHEAGVSDDCTYISSQHPNFPIDESLVEFDTVLRTPIFDFESFPTVRQLPCLNGVNNSFYCGSYFGHGLHEDAVSSAVSVARQLGAVW